MTNNIQTAKVPFTGLVVPCFRQAWQLLKENKLYSTIYILGTALAITMVMIVSVFLFIKKGDIPPEINRSRTLYVGSVNIYPKDTTQRGMSASNLSLQTVKSVFYPLKSAETVTAVFNTFGDDNLLSLPGQKQELPMMVKYTDANYWNLFRFRFVEGKPYSKEEFASGIRNAVIDASTARRLFGGNSAIGKTVLLNDTEYRVSGVVKDVSYILSHTYANIWIPYTTNENYEKSFAAEGILGSYSVFVLASSAKHFSEIRKEVATNIAGYEGNLTWRMDLLGQPDNAFTASFRKGNRPLSIHKIRRSFAALWLVFLLVPVLNLSGLNSSRMEKRLPELGIRKAFGATRTVLTQQLVTENFLLTFLGGAVGLILSYLLVYFSSQWLVPSSILYNITDMSAQLGEAVGVTPAMLFNVRVFTGALLAVLLMNLLSSLVPAYRFTRKNIIDALFDHYK